MYNRCGPAVAVYQAGGISFSIGIVMFNGPLVMARSAQTAANSAAVT
jgi:hypothetical protein